MGGVERRVHWVDVLAGMLLGYVERVYWQAVN